MTASEDMTPEDLENWIKEFIPFKEKEITDLLTRYQLEHVIKADDLHACYVLINHRIRFHKDEKQEEEAIQDDYENIKKVLSSNKNRDPDKVEFHGITLNFSFKGERVSVTLKSSFFINPILELIGDLVYHFGYPTEKEKKRGAKRSDNVFIIEELAPIIAEIIRDKTALSNLMIYNFIFDFLQLCEFRWDDTGWGHKTDKDIRELKIQTIKKYLQPFLKKGK